MCYEGGGNQTGTVHTGCSEINESGVEWLWFFTRILEMKGRLEIRNRTKVIEVSRICTRFFSIGVIAVVLKDAGTVADKKEEWQKLGEPGKGGRL